MMTAILEIASMTEGIEYKIHGTDSEGSQTADSFKPGVSLASKGLITLTCMVVYFIFVSVIIAYERHSLIDSVKLLNEIHQREERVITLNILVARAILTVNENYFSPNVDVSSKILVLEIETVVSGLEKIGQHYAPLVDRSEQLKSAMAQLVEQPSRPLVADIRGVFHRVVIDLDDITSDIRNRKQWLLDDYQETHTRLTFEWFSFVVVGLGCLSGLMMFFFRKLAADILSVRKRATEIVRGYRGPPLLVKRTDELGELIKAINNMQDELRKHEMQIELGRQQKFHKDKMSAIGSLAAAVAHEINNPLSAIVGVAQDMIDEECNNGCGRQGGVCHPRLIMEQAKRVMQITRQIGEFAVPRSQEPELIDINGLIRNTCHFIGFDRRFRGVQLMENFDHELPAVQVVADHIVQVLMNLLINAADALESCSERKRTITVRTRRQDDAVVVTVSDNGCGISPQLIDHIFDEHFTTKAPGRGFGLGLALCRSLINNFGGNIFVESTFGEGTDVMLVLPITFQSSLKNNKLEKE